MNRRIEVTGFQREVKRKKRVIEYAEKNRNIKTACVDSSSLRHAMHEEETDLSFAEFDGSERLYPAPTPERDISETGNYAKSLARREGFASSLRLRRLRDA